MCLLIYERWLSAIQIIPPPTQQQSMIDNKSVEKPQAEVGKLESQCK